MSFESNKVAVLDLFENHIIKYIVKDLEVLDSIKPDASGAGGCAIPQASATFSALDLMGYLTHPQELNVVNMSFSNLLGDSRYFPTIQHLINQTGFLEMIRDNVRSIMSHRFSLSTFDITKGDNSDLFFEEGGRVIFNTSHLTTLTISVIQNIYQSIVDNTFTINGYTNEESIAKMKVKIDNLKTYVSGGFTFRGLPISSTTTETTSSLG